MLTRNAAVELIDRVYIYEGGKIEVQFLHAQDYQEMLGYLTVMEELHHSEAPMHGQEFYAGTQERYKEDQAKEN